MRSQLCFLRSSVSVQWDMFKQARDDNHRNQCPYELGSSGDVVDTKSVAIISANSGKVSRATHEAHRAGKGSYNLKHLFLFHGTQPSDRSLRFHTRESSIMPKKFSNILGKKDAKSRTAEPAASEASSTPAAAPPVAAVAVAEIPAENGSRGSVSPPESSTPTLERSGSQNNTGDGPISTTSEVSAQKDSPVSGSPETSPPVERKIPIGGIGMGALGLSPELLRMKRGTLGPSESLICRSTSHTLPDSASQPETKQAAPAKPTIGPFMLKKTEKPAQPVVAPPAAAAAVPWSDKKKLLNNSTTGSSTTDKPVPIKEKSKENIVQESVANAGPHKELPVPQKELPVPQKELPVPQKELPVPQKELPVPQKELPVPQKELPVPQKELPVPQKELPVPQKELPVPQKLGSSGNIQKELPVLPKAEISENVQKELPVLPGGPQKELPVPSKVEVSENIQKELPTLPTPEPQKELPVPPKAEISEKIHEDVTPREKTQPVALTAAQLIEQRTAGFKQVDAIPAIGEAEVTVAHVAVTTPAEVQAKEMEREPVVAGEISENVHKELPVPPKAEISEKVHDQPPIVQEVILQDELPTPTTEEKPQAEEKTDEISEKSQPPSRKTSTASQIPPVQENSEKSQPPSRKTSNAAQVPPAQENSEKIHSRKTSTASQNPPAGEISEKSPRSRQTSIASQNPPAQENSEKIHSRKPSTVEAAEISEKTHSRQPSTAARENSEKIPTETEGTLDGVTAAGPVLKSIKKPAGASRRPPTRASAAVRAKAAMPNEPTVTPTKVEIEDPAAAAGGIAAAAASKRNTMMYGGAPQLGAIAMAAAQRQAARPVVGDPLVNRGKAGTAAPQTDFRSALKSPGNRATIAPGSISPQMVAPSAFKRNAEAEFPVKAKATTSPPPPQPEESEKSEEVPKPEENGKAEATEDTPTEPPKSPALVIQEIPAFNPNTPKSPKSPKDLAKEQAREQARMKKEEAKKKKEERGRFGSMPRRPTVTTESPRVTQKSNIRLTFLKQAKRIEKERKAEEKKRKAEEKERKKKEDKEKKEAAKLAKQQAKEAKLSKKKE
ncbi:hypothetical protein PROFUN_12848, partial [Planoprotostelium fungivorum]